MTQVKIYDRENGLEHGGIITDDGDIICGCCGGLIERDEISVINCDNKNLSIIKRFHYEDNNESSCSTEIRAVFNTWIDLSDSIIGE